MGPRFRSLGTAAFLSFFPIVVVSSGASAAGWRWREITPPSGDAPSARRNGTAIYDARERRVILFGGTDSSGNLNDVWSFDVDGRVWEKRTPTGGPPAPRFGHNAVYDPAGHRMILWSGQGTSFFSDTWLLDLSTFRWTEATPASRPAARYGSAAVFDPGSRRLAMFGGFTTAGRYQDIQAFSPDAAAWTDLTPPGARPVERCLHTAAYEAARRRMIVYGGQQSGPLDDLWAFDLAASTWSNLTPPARPAGRMFASSFVDRDGRFCVFGGSTAAGNVSETWAFDFGSGQWALLDLPGAPPARNGMQAAFLEAENRLIVFGGTGDRLLRDVWELAPDAPAVAETWILPSAARAAGLGGAFYTTGLWIANVGDSAAAVTLKFLQHDQDGRTGPERTFTLGAGETIAREDVLGGFFGIAEGYGGIRITSGSASLAILSQTSTPAPGAGSFGQSVPAFRVSERIATGTSRTIPGVREDDAFRTNLVLANGTESALDVDVLLVGADGAPLGSRRWTLPPLGMTQVSRVLNAFGLAQVPAGARLVLATPGSGGLAAYAALIDNVTNDARTLLPR